MKNFLIYIFSVIIVVATIIGIGEHLVRQVPNPYKFKHEWMQVHHDEVEILTLGGSHSFFGIRPELLGKNAFSLANVSQNLQYDYYLFNKYNCPNLKEVVMAISFPTLFSGSMEDGREPFRANYYKIYMDCPYHSNFSKYNFEFMLHEVYRQKLEKAIKKTEKDYNEYGSNISNTLKNKNMAIWNDNSDALKAAKRHERNDFSNLDTNLSRLQTIADYCHKHSVKLVLVIPFLLSIRILYFYLFFLTILKINIIFAAEIKQRYHGTKMPCI